MKRPYIICHMVTSIDGKVTGSFLSSPKCEDAVEVYYEINRALKCDGFICGRVTMEQSFTHGRYPDLTEYTSEQSKADFIPDPRDMTGFYALSFDPKGKLGWESAFIQDEDPGYDKAQVIEVLTDQADKRYLSYLRKMNIPYIFAGEKEIDVKLALSKLYESLGIKKILLEGGSIINGAFQRAGVIDELSLVVAPIVAEKDDRLLFTDSVAEGYALIGNRVSESGVVWLNYGK